MATLKVLLRQPRSLVAMLLIMVALFTAIAAYKIAPDNSLYANTIVPELANKPAKFSIQVLLIKKGSNLTVNGNWWQGYQYPYTLQPIEKIIRTTPTNIIVQRYVDDGVTDTLTVPLVQLYQPLPQQLIFHLGSDKFGRDVLSRLIIGTRVSISVGCIAVVISLLLGVFLGSIAGYFGGAIDTVVQWLVNVMWSIPTLLLVFALTLLLGKGFWQVFVAVGLTMWVGVARLVRGQVLAVKNLTYIEAAKILGLPHYIIILKHILPNIAGPILVWAASNFASAIVIEAGLSFLGIGVQPPQPSWGLMMKENYNFIITNKPMLALAPGIAIMLLVLAFNLLGNALRDVFDVKTNH
jgi:peptide/nickel transport system permease protein